MEQFKNLVKQELEDRGYEVRLVQITKNNGLKLDGVNLITKENMVPTIYLNQFFADYTDGKVTIKDICSEIIHISRNNQFDDEMNVKELVTDWNQAKERIAYRLVGYEKNQELLENRPHRRYLDMAVTYQVQITDEASVAVTNELMNLYGVSINDLEEAAQNNTPVISPVIIEEMES